jgi:hypothetical protein
MGLSKFTENYTQNTAKSEFTLILKTLKNCPRVPNARWQLNHATKNCAFVTLTLPQLLGWPCMSKYSCWVWTQRV